MAMPYSAVVVGVGLSTTVGLFFGIYPARRAAQLGSDRGAEGGEMSGSEILSAVRMALATIREHKMRSLLTVLGVIIGTGTVIAVGSIITGVDARSPTSCAASARTRASSSSSTSASGAESPARRFCASR